MTTTRLKTSVFFTGRPFHGLAAVVMLAAFSCRAGFLDDIGATLLFNTTTNLNGSGIRVAQVEVEYTPGGTDWEMDPLNIGRASNYVTYYYSPVDTATAYPNSYGTDSGHADSVAANLLQVSVGVATNIPHIDEYEANYFAGTVIPESLPLANANKIITQSYTYGAQTASNQMIIDQSFDDFAAQYKTLFFTGTGNGGSTAPPATCYNGLGVGAYQGNTASGPTIDNGRAKPDICAPASETSLSTPIAAGAAAILLQAALRGDGGSDTSSASDMRTLKALLMNGAVKPGDWSAPSPSPLDKIYGAGVLNIFNSYRQLTGGKHAFSSATSVSAGGAHPPLGTGAVVASLSGWNFGALTNTTATDAIEEYDFNLTNSAVNASFTTTISLVWNRQQNYTNINNLCLYLYNLGTGQLVASAASTVDNVQVIYLRNLPAGRYALQVLKSGAGFATATESYALAYEYFAETLGMTRTTGGLVFTWPIYPAGFSLQASDSLSSPNWSAVTNTPTLSNSLNRVVVPVGSGSRFFRLQR